METNLGLRPSGVERLGAVLLDLGLAERGGGKFAGRLQAPQFDHWRDPALGARNVRAAAALAGEQADRVGEIIDDGGFPVVLGGDDSVLLGCLLALRRRGPAGLVLLDGHTDYWDHADCLDDELMPAVDWRIAGGLSERGRSGGAGRGQRDPAATVR